MLSAKAALMTAADRIAMIHAIMEAGFTEIDRIKELIAQHQAAIAREYARIETIENGIANKLDQQVPGWRALLDPDRGQP